MRKVLAYFIKYPVAVNIFIIGFLIFGYLGHNQLNSSFFPLADPSIVRITVSYPGASPVEVEEGIVEKIEANLEGEQGIDRVTSVSQENLATISIETEESADINMVLDDVKNAVDRIASFPRSMEPPVIKMVSPTRAAISFSLLSSENTPLSYLKRKAQQIEDDLRKLDNVSQINLSGFPAEEIEITLDEDQLRAYNLTLEEVASRVAAENILISGGTIKTDENEFLIRADNKSYTSDGFLNILIKTQPDGTKIRLGQIATVKDQFEDTVNASFLNTKRVVSFSVTNTNDEDLIQSVEEIRAYIENFNKKESALEIIVTSDSSAEISGRISLLLENAIIGMILVLLLLSVFLRPQVALWVAFGLPISFFGMFIVLPYYGVTLNMLSLFGMIIVIGILVDDGIVIAENIYAQKEKGKSPIKAAIDGTMEVMNPILSAITTTILAFGIFLFLEGQIGGFFKDIAIVVIVTLLVSLVEALLILPAHLGHSSDLKQDARTYKINEYGDKAMNFLKDRIYTPAITWCMSHQFISFSILIAMMLLTVGGFFSGAVKFTFFPSNASDSIVITAETPYGTSPQVVDSLSNYIERQVLVVNKELGDNLKGNDHVKSTVRKLGPGSSSSTITVNLSPSETRSLASPEITDLIREKVGVMSTLEKLSFNSGGNVGGSPISISIRSEDKKQLDGAREMVYQHLQTTAGVKDIVDNSPDGTKEVSFKLNSQGRQLGLTLNDVMTQVRNGYFGREVQRLQRSDDEVKVWVRYDKAYRNSLESLDNIQVKTQNSRVFLRDVTTYSIETGAVAINHRDGMKEITIEADVASKDVSAAQIMNELTTSFAKGLKNKFPEVAISQEGQSRETNKIFESAAVVIPASIFLIYLVIVFAFRSYSQPLQLLAMIPFTMIGVVWGHVLHGFSVSILSFLGIIGLVGIVVNDGLVFTSKFNDHLKQGHKFIDALIETGRSRFRAIFLTSITTIAGMAPLVFEKSRQAQFIIPMAISIAYGIAIATVLTLFVLPIFISATNKSKVYFKYLFTGKKPEREEVERAIKELEVDKYEV